MERKETPQDRYHRTHMQQFAVALHRTYDADIIRILQESKNKSGLIRELLRYYLIHPEILDVPEEEPADYELRRIEHEIP